MRRFFPGLTATGSQVTAYLLGVALFSISFLVFLNSVLSFVVTDVIGRRHGTGDIVGTLGFADELLALVACPLWGVLSDRVGVRNVAFIGYCIVGLSLICLVKSTNVYPELLLGRLGFSLGASACSTMVTAVLPAMIAARADSDEERAHHVEAEGQDGEPFSEDAIGASTSTASESRIQAPSVESELTITQNRYRSTPGIENDLGVGNSQDRSDTSRLAGLVGLFTGAGALLALLIFLPLPAFFQKQGQSEAQSVRTSFYIVGAIAFCVAVFIFFGLRDLPNEEGKSWSALWQRPYDEETKADASGHLHTRLIPAPSYFRLARDALMLGFTDRSIALGYIGGFVARTSSVAISLFIPLFVKSYFIDQGFCDGDPNDPTDIKEHCRRAYTLASALSGIAETAALLCAPLFGWLGSKLLKSAMEWPLLGASVAGIVGYISFGFLHNPDPFHGEGGKATIIIVILIGINQIGAIVTSLALIGRGIQHVSGKTDGHQFASADTGAVPRNANDIAITSVEESAPLLNQDSDGPAGKADRDELVRRHRFHLKGSIAGMYSFLGGAGILLLNKLGGSLFDTWTRGAPFFLLAMFNTVLFVAVICFGLTGFLRNTRSTTK